MTAAQARYEAAVLASWAAGPADGAHDLGHLRRVWANACAIAREEPDADMQVLLAAAMLHDLVNLPKSSPDRATASRLSARAAVPLLQAEGLTAAQIAATCHAIAAHSFSAGIAPETPEAKIIQDADRLEALVAIGIARMFYVAGATGGQLFCAEDPMALHRAPDDRRFALDHIATKLLLLPAQMQTATGRAMAEARADWLMSFRTRLLAEIG